MTVKSLAFFAGNGGKNRIGFQ